MNSTPPRTCLDGSQRCHPCPSASSSSDAEQGTTPENIAPIGLPSPPGRPVLLANESLLRSPSFLGKADPRSLVGSASLMKVSASP